MAEIKPFKGIFYNQTKIKDLSRVVSPPYDVISEREQENFYKKSPYNIIRIILGKDFKKDTEPNNKYIRARKYFLKWCLEKILIQDELPSIYIYLQEFSYKDIKRERLGFIALLKLEDFYAKNIYPHEGTMDGPKVDRFKLLKSVHANLSPIFALFSDKDKKISNCLKENIKLHSPIIDIYDTENVRHCLWSLKAHPKINRIKDFMKHKKIFIADGHHRYEVALEFSKEMKDERFGFIMSYFTGIEGEGLVILPVYRLVQGISQDEAFIFLKEKIRGRFLLRRFNSRHSLLKFLTDTKRPHRFGVYLGKGGFWGLDPLKAFDGSALDVDILQRFILRPLLENFTPLQKQSSLTGLAKKGNSIRLEFTKDLDSAIEWVDRGSKRLAFFLIPTKISQVENIARLGKRLPQKATYFYPKPLSGLVINAF